VIAVPFRLFGRPHPGPGGPDPRVPPGDDGWARGSGTATRYARPARRAEDLLGPDPREDPLTDPFGFAPVPAAPYGPTGPGSAPWTPLVERRVESPAPEPVPHPAEAAALAAAFASDYLSWDEEDPGRRALVLADYLRRSGPVNLGWDGVGRQRADFALPGLVRPDGEGRLLVDVRVRVTPYRSVGERGGVPVDVEVGVAGVPAAAPAPTARGWRSLPSHWVRISIAIAVDGERLVVDAGEEELDEGPGGLS
jgi:hypothetical protein